MATNTVGVVIFDDFLKDGFTALRWALKEFVAKSPRPKLCIILIKKADVAEAPVIQQPLTGVVPCMHHDDMYSNPPLFNQLIASYIFCIISLCGTEAGDQRGVNGSWSKFLLKFKPSAYIPKITQALKRSDPSLE